MLGSGFIPLTLLGPEDRAHGLAAGVTVAVNGTITALIVPVLVGWLRLAVGTLRNRASGQC